jgi:glycosyltransferase involved in cell wall biosynthesis
MKIVHLSTYDLRGGASLAAHRQHRAMLQAGYESVMLVRHKHSTDDSVMQVVTKATDHDVESEQLLGNVIQTHYIDSHRSDRTDTIFSFPYPAYDVSESSSLQEADIINLHWVAHYQSPATLKRLFALGKPVVWTLHDQWPFTGGCHYSAGCDMYRDDCADCPQLAKDTFQLPRAVLEDKLALFQGANLSIVTPSSWLADCARGSSLFKDLRVEAISNALDTDTYAPVPKARAKKRLGVDPETSTILFVAQQRSERRKGVEHLAAALEHCLRTAEFRKLVDLSAVALLCLGGLREQPWDLGIPMVSLGYINSDERIRSAYAAADIFVLPSLEDNLPNTMLEAMSCGTPVVAYDVGGIPEAVISDVTGRLVPVGDTRGLAEGILALLFNSNKRRAMGRSCRRMMEERYSPPEQARRYADLYRALLGPHGSAGLVEPQETTSQPHPTRKGSDSPEQMATHARLQDALGPHFQAIHDRVLFRSLMEFAPDREQRHTVALAKLEAENRDLRLHLDNLRSTRSWKITKPLRAFGRFLANLRQ